MSDEKLLPCPFCGGEAVECRDNVIKHAWVECLDCGVTTPNNPDSINPALAWNRRARGQVREQP